MSDTTTQPSTPQPSAPGFPQEVASCLACGATIYREHLVCQERTDPAGQRIRAWCEHCKSMFECRRELRGGMWQLVGGVETVTDPRRREKFLHRIAAQRNVVQA